MAIRAVIFDFGGVLVRTEDYGGRRAWEARLGLGQGELEKQVFDCEVSLRCSVGELPENDLWRHLAESFRLGPDEMAQFRQDFWGGDRLDTALVDFLRGLRPGVKTAILSNAWSEAREVFTQRFGLGDAVDDIIISAEEGAMKPDPRIYALAARRLGVRPEEAVFVDDLPRNVEGARAAGMHGVLFKTTAQTIAEVRALLEPAA